MARIVTEAERMLLNHVTMFGSAGYPVRKLGRKWTWGTEQVKGPPTMFDTKREAVASFEAWQDAMREALGAEAQQRAIADLRRRGYSEAEIWQMVEDAKRRA